MAPLVVSAHNPMTGPRHLGHLVSTMIDWPRLQRDHQLIIVIDDLIATILYPRARQEVEKRTFIVVKEFMSTGIDLNEAQIVLTSMLPEAHEFGLFASLGISHEWCRSLFAESFPGLLSSYQRRELGLPRLPSVAEVVYPQVHLAGLTLALHASFFQGGEEMRGYIGLMEAMAESLDNRGRLKVPAFLPGRSTFLNGTDGHHMAGENAVYLSASEAETYQTVGKVQSLEVVRQWFQAMDRADVLERVLPSTEQELRAETIASIAQLLSAELLHFRDSQISNMDIVRMLERSATEVRTLIRDTLVEIKGRLGIPGFSNH